MGKFFLQIIWQSGDQVGQVIAPVKVVDEAMEDGDTAEPFM
jgi:hypothetical protein